jgi:D-galactarolactone cycloisomerase
MTGLLTMLVSAREDLLKITKVETFILRAPLQRPFAYSQGWYRARTALVVRVLTDEGIEGVGECYGPPEPNAAVILHAYAPLLVGRNPLESDVIWEQLYNFLRDHGQKGDCD